MNKTGIMLASTGIGAGVGGLIGGLIGFSAVNSIRSSVNVGYLADGNPAMPYAMPSPIEYVLTTLLNAGLGLPIGAALGLLLGYAAIRMRARRPTRASAPERSMPSHGEAPSPGWYKFPDATLGYWNGQAWTDSRPPGEVAQ